MLSILDRYFLRELAQTLLAVALVLAVIVAGGMFARVVEQVANGTFPSSVMFPVLGLRVVDGLSGLLPLACFLGVMQALGRMYRESEMHVLASSGMGVDGLLRPAAILTVALVALIAVVSLWLGPMASRTSDAMVDDANRSVVAAGLSAGHFTELPGKGGIIFVDKLSRDGRQLGRAFIAQERVSSGQKQLKIVTGTDGNLYQESDGNGRFLAIRNGWQYQIPLGGLKNWRRMQYQQNDASISNIDSDDSDDSTHNLSTWQLLQATTADARAELAWRIASPVTAFVLMLLALPLSRQSPREPRFGRLLLAVLGYFLYFTLLALCRNQIAAGKWHHSTPMWGLHLVTIVLAVRLLYVQYAPRKQRRAPSAPVSA